MMMLMKDLTEISNGMMVMYVSCTDNIHGVIGMVMTALGPVLYMRRQS